MLKLLEFGNWAYPWKFGRKLKFFADHEGKVPNAPNDGQMFIKVHVNKWEMFSSMDMYIDLSYSPLIKYLNSFFPVQLSYFVWIIDEKRILAISK